MSVTIPSSDIESTKLNGVITSRTAHITAAGNNGPLVALLTTLKAQDQLQLVLHLLSSGKVSASSVLSNCTYGQ